MQYVHTNTYRKKKAKGRGKNPIGLYRNVHNRLTHCTILELKPAPCDAAYGSVGAKKINK